MGEAGGREHRRPAQGCKMHGLVPQGDRTGHVACRGRGHAGELAQPRRFDGPVRGARELGELGACARVLRG